MIPQVMAYLKDLAYQIEWVLRAERGLPFSITDSILADCCVVAELNGRKFNEFGDIVFAWNVLSIDTVSSGE